MDYYASAEGHGSGYNLGASGMGAPMLDSGGNSGPQGQEEWPQDHATSGPGTSVRNSSGSLEQSFFQINLQEAALEREYPQRSGEPDCNHYMRTGSCAFGRTCRFNHPLNRKQAGGPPVRGSPVGMGLGVGGVGGGSYPGGFTKSGEYPERPGQPDCQYYLKTGSCKFGATCKYNHPGDQAGAGGKVVYNAAGFPVRLGERECSYYMRTGQCKYGSTCKFNHPPMPLGNVPSSPGFLGGGAQASPSPQIGGIPWPLPRGPFLPGPRIQGPGGYTPMMMPPPQGVVPLQGWGYQNPMAPIGSPDPSSGQPIGSPAYLFGPLPSDPSAVVGGAYSTFASTTLGLPPGQTGASPKDHSFPERPNQPECQYYLKTGDCKFGMTCRYHHPKERALPPPTALLSVVGLPLRPGAQPCPFYLRHGICKFGHTCKFDHPFRGTETSPEGQLPLGPYSHLAMAQAPAPPLAPEGSDGQSGGQYREASEEASQEGQQQMYGE